MRDLPMEAMNYKPKEKGKKLPKIDAFADNFAGRVNDLFRLTNEKYKKQVNELILHKESISNEKREVLIRVFLDLIKRCEFIITELKPEKLEINHGSENMPELLN
jgi:hypothetical protein